MAVKKKMNLKFCLLLAVLAVAGVTYVLLFVWNEKFSYYMKPLHALLFKQSGPITAAFLDQRNNANVGSIGRQVTQPTSNAQTFKGRMDPHALSKQFLIYVCHRRPLCGGWSDRQRGMVSVYLLSLVTGRRFGIIMDDPCSITRYYVPNDVNWVITPAELKNKTSAMINDMGSRGGISQMAREGNFNERYPQDVVYVYSNNGGIGYVLGNAKRHFRNIPKWIDSRTSTFVKAWRALMRPTPYLQKRLDDYLQSFDYEQRTQPLVCCHVRTGKSATIIDDPVRLDVSNISVLWNFLSGYVKNGSKVFMATDNQQIRKSNREHFGESALDTGGAIVHVDKWKGDKSHACDGFEYALLDQLILTKCDILVLTGSPFGWRAAWLGGGRKGRFVLREKQVVRT